MNVGPRSEGRVRPRRNTVGAAPGACAAHSAADVPPSPSAQAGDAAGRVLAGGEWVGAIWRRSRRDDVAVLQGTAIGLFTSLFCILLHGAARLCSITLVLPPRLPPTPPRHPPVLQVGPKRRYMARLRDMRSLRDLLIFHLDDLDDIGRTLKERNAAPALGGGGSGGRLSKTEFALVVHEVSGGVRF